MGQPEKLEPLTATLLDDAPYERRAFPRVAVSSELRISNRVSQAVNVSEAGLSFLCPRETFNAPLAAELQLGSKTIKAGIELVWRKPHAPELDVAGARFIDLPDDERLSLRWALFSSEITPLLTSIAQHEERDKVKLFFLEDVYRYFTEMQKLIQALDSGRIELKEAEGELTRLTDAVLAKGDALGKCLNNRKVLKDVKAYFRRLTGPWAYKGIIVRRALDKPRGYPGDYLLLESIYNNVSPSRGIGICSDSYFLNNSYSTAVRHRLEELKEVLKAFISKHPSKTLRILNIACGSSREFRDLMENHAQFFGPKNMRVTCFDQDEEALEFSKQRLGNVAHGTSFEFVKGDVLRSSGEGAFPSRYHLVYTIGLADYLPDRVLKKLILAWVHLLEPRGKLVITHKDVEKSNPLAPDWFCDWNFYPRTEEKLKELLDSLGLNNVQLRIHREPSQQIMFLTLQHIP